MRGGIRRDVRCFNKIESSYFSVPILLTMGLKEILHILVIRKYINIDFDSIIVGIKRRNMRKEQ